MITRRKERKKERKKKLTKQNCLELANFVEYKQNNMQVLKPTTAKNHFFPSISSW
jgi:hypothetical protein